MKRRQTLAVLAAVAAPVGVLATPALAQASGLTFTSVTNAEYSNAPAAPVTFSGAGSDDVVVLWADGTAAGSTTAAGDGTGIITPSAPVATQPHETASLTLAECTSGTVPANCLPGSGVAEATVNVDYNWVPAVGGPMNSPSSALPADETDQFSVGNAIPDEPVNLYLDGSVAATATANGSGVVQSLQVPAADLTPGAHTYYATSVDAAGNESAPSTLVTFYVAPASPSFADSQLDNYSEFYVDSSTPTFQLTGADPSASEVEIYEDTNGSLQLLGETGTVAGDGTASVSVSPALADGQYTLVAAQTVNGVSSVGTTYYGPDTVDLGVDTGTPTLSASFSPATTTTNTSPVFSATDAANGIFGINSGSLGVTYTVTDNTTGATFTSADPNMTGLLDQALTVGDNYTVVAHTLDGLGEQGATPSNALTFTVTSASGGGTGGSGSGGGNTGGGNTGGGSTAGGNTGGGNTGGGASTPTPKLPSAHEIMAALTTILHAITSKPLTVAELVKQGGYSVSFEAPSAGTVTIKWYATIKGKRTLIASVTAHTHGGKLRIKVKLDAIGKRLLRSARKSLRISQWGSFKPAGGKQDTSTRTVSLKG